MPGAAGNVSIGTVSNSFPVPVGPAHSGDAALRLVSYAEPARSMMARRRVEPRRPACSKIGAREACPVVRNEEELRAKCEEISRVEQEKRAIQAELQVAEQWGEEMLSSMEAKEKQFAAERERLVAQADAAPADMERVLEAARARARAEAVRATEFQRSLEATRSSLALATKEKIAAEAARAEAADVAAAKQKTLEKALAAAQLAANSGEVGIVDTQKAREGAAKAEAALEEGQCVLATAIENEDSLRSMLATAEAQCEKIQAEAALAKERAEAATAAQISAERSRRAAERNQQEAEKKRDEAMDMALHAKQQIIEAQKPIQESLRAALEEADLAARSSRAELKEVHLTAARAEAAKAQAEMARVKAIEEADAERGVISNAAAKESSEVRIAEKVAEKERTRAEKLQCRLDQAHADVALERTRVAALEEEWSQVVQESESSLVDLEREAERRRTLEYELRSLRDDARRQKNQSSRKPPKQSVGPVVPKAEAELRAPLDAYSEVGPGRSSTSPRLRFGGLPWIVVITAALVVLLSTGHLIFSPVQDQKYTLASATHLSNAMREMRAERWAQCLEEVDQVVHSALHDDVKAQQMALMVRSSCLFHSGAPAATAMNVCRQALQLFPERLSARNVCADLEGEAARSVAQGGAAEQGRFVH